MACFWVETVVAPPIGSGARTTFPTLLLSFKFLRLEVSIFEIHSSAQTSKFRRFEGDRCNPSVLGIAPTFGLN